jgi:hypothetical protein
MEIRFRAREEVSDVIIERSSFPYIIWNHEVTLMGVWDKNSAYVQEELKHLRKTTNCKHQNKQWDTVNHAGGEVGKGLICLDCDKLLKYE